MRQRLVCMCGAMLLSACVAPGFTQAPSGFQGFGPDAAQPLSPLISRRLPNRGARMVLYQNDLALIEEERQVIVPASNQTTRRLWVQDLPTALVPGSQRLAVAGNQEPWRIQTQTYIPPDITHQALLEAFVGEQVEIHVPPVAGSLPLILRPTLIASQGDGIFSLDGKILLKPPGQVVLPNLPSHLVGRSTLSWTLDGVNPGNNSFTLGYSTQRIGWQCEHVVRVTPEGIAFWQILANLRNEAGIDFLNTRLTLIAGTPRSAVQPMLEIAPAPMGRGDTVVSVAPTMGYQRFELSKPADLVQRHLQQVSLAEFPAVRLKRLYLLDSQRIGDQEAPVEIQWHGRNIREDGLGWPLPAGTVHLEGAEDATKRQWLGDDTLAHIPVEQPIRLHQGWSFDLRGKRSVNRIQRLDTKQRTESIQVLLSNASDTAAVVRVVEHLYGDWTLETSSHPPNPQDGQALSFDVPVDAHGQNRLTLTIRYRE